ncbi:MAG: DUF5689 domain-containing protein [Muribaculaceae bacterium]|nr:DUF5689 domain-containing protein [Muribaculaceae bacterium]
MKKTLLYIAVALTSAVGFSSCDDDFERPPITIPGQGDQIEANVTLLELKQQFYNSSTSNYASEIGTNADGEHYIVRGRIISDDQTGNIFKTLMIQDESAGMAFSINISSLYENYKYGAEIAVDVTGLYIGAYGNNMQIGAAPTTNDYPSRIEEDVWKEHCTVQSVPQPDKVVVHSVTMEELKDIKADPSQMLAWQNRLVKLDNMKFERPGQPFGESSTTVSRNLIGPDGSRIIMRNSGYSTWWAQLQPAGEGSVTAILSYFSRDWQLMLNSPDNLSGFTEAEPEKPVEAGTGTKDDPYTVAQLVQEGAPSAAQPDKWVKGYIVGFIPDMSLSEAVFSADGAVATNIVIGATAETNSSTAVLPVQLPAGVIRSGVNLKDNPANLGKEILLKGSVERYFGTCGVKSVTAAVIDGKEIGQGGDTPSTPAGQSIFSESFATGQGSFTINDKLLPSGLSYIWSYASNYKCMKASAFANSTNHDADSYLVSPEIDLTGYTDVQASFEQAVNFFTDIATARKEAAFAVSTDGGTTWTALDIPSYPSELSWTFAPTGAISLKAYAGKKIKVAFHYTGTAAKCGTWEVKNLVITGTK